MTNQDKPTLGAFPTDKTATDKTAVIDHEATGSPSNVKSQQVVNQEKAAEESKKRQEDEAAARAQEVEKPKEYLFDPSRPAAMENARDAAARQAYMGRLQAAQAATREAIEARARAVNALKNAQSNVTELEALATKAEAAATEAHAKVAPKPEPMEPSVVEHAKAEVDSKEKIEADSKLRAETDLKLKAERDETDSKTEGKTPVPKK